ncbi:MAG: hypothetical protein M0R06_08845 [Sphaerochaeta sp.]|nr:hypothetical protein [Sphaerochaeta sp.]
MEKGNKTEGKKMKKALGFMAAALITAGPVLGASVRPVTLQERAFVGATHIVTIEHSDLTETNTGTAQTLTNVLNVAAKQRVELIGMELVTAFDAGNNATGSVLVTVGDGAAGADFYLDSTEVDLNKTEVWAKYGRGYQGLTTASLVYARTNAPTVTVTKQTTTPVFAATNDPVVAVAPIALTADMLAATNDPVVVVSKETATLDYAATNDPAIVVTLQTVVGYDSTGAAITNAEGANINYVTGVVVSATLTAGAAVEAMTNASATATLTASSEDRYMIGATATATLTAGASVAIMTNATATATVTPGTQTVATAITDSASGRKVYTGADTIDFAFTPNAENSLSENTAGELRFYFKIK